MSSLAGLDDFSMLIGSTNYRPSSVQNLDKTKYSQFLKQMLFLIFGHEVTIITSFDLPCNLWLADAVLMLTGKSVILDLNDY